MEIPSYHIRNAASFKVEKTSTPGTSLLFLYSQTLLCVTFYMGYTKIWLILVPTPPALSDVPGA